MLVIGGTHDPATPYRWAKRLVADLGNARLLTYRADGHGAITDLNGCIIGWSLAYLEAGVSARRRAQAAGRWWRTRRRCGRAAQQDLRAWKRTTVPELR